MSIHDSETVENVKPALGAAKYFVHSSERSGVRIRRRQPHRPASQREPRSLSRAAAHAHAAIAASRTCRPKSSRCRRDETYAMAVADGMGGCGCGALASQIAIRTAWDLAGRTTSWVMKLDDLDSAELTERIEGFVYLMQQAFVQEFQAQPAVRRKRHDVYGGVLRELVCRRRANRRFAQLPLARRHMRRVSVDHTIEQEFISAGVAPEIAGKFSHMLTRCLGYESHNARPDVHFLRLRAGRSNAGLHRRPDRHGRRLANRRVPRRFARAPKSACDALIKTGPRRRRQR